MARWRYLAQDVLTGEFLHRDLPLRREELSWQLSGPGALTGTVDRERADLSRVLREWQTAIYAEAEGEIRWGGLLRTASPSGGKLRIESAGFSSYPSDMPYVGPYYRRVGADPLEVFEAIWDYLQSQPDGDLGLGLTRPVCPVRIGTPEEPYELSWWEAPDCGAELQSLAAETPFDFVERHRWGAGSTVSHTLDLSWPRAGRKREDLAFVQGVNVTSVVEPVLDGDGFANTVYGLGKGEGARTVHGEVSTRDGRLRRVRVVTDKLASTSVRITALARREHALRALRPEISSITVRSHENAPIGSWALGDDLLVRATLPWAGEVAVWSRVMSWSLLSDTTASLALERSDSFTYGA